MYKLCPQKVQSSVEPLQTCDLMSGIIFHARWQCPLIYSESFLMAAINVHSVGEPNGWTWSMSHAGKEQSVQCFVYMYGHVPYHSKLDSRQVETAILGRHVLKNMQPCNPNPRLFKPYVPEKNFFWGVLKSDSRGYRWWFCVKRSTGLRSANVPKGTKV